VFTLDYRIWHVIDSKHIHHSLSAQSYSLALSIHIKHSLSVTFCPSYDIDALSLAFGSLSGSALKVEVGGVHYGYKVQYTTAIRWSNSLLCHSQLDLRFS
jgi:hypothetical protein